MSKKILIMGVVVVLAAIVTASALFLFPYQPDQPPESDDTGSTQQGIQEVVNANN